MAETMQTEQQVEGNVSCVSVQKSIYGVDIVGRRISVKAYDQKSGFNGYLNATVLGYDVNTGAHTVKFSKKRYDTKVFVLDTYQFKWKDLPQRDRPPHHSFFTSPKGQDAVGKLIRVYFPGEASWCLGRVRSYQPDEDMHSIDYFDDGDTIEHMLKYEAVEWPLSMESIPASTPHGQAYRLRSASSCESDPDPVAPDSITSGMLNNSAVGTASGLDAHRAFAMQTTTNSQQLQPDSGSLIPSTATTTTTTTTTSNSPSHLNNSASQVHLSEQQTEMLKQASIHLQKIKTEKGASKPTSVEQASSPTAAATATTMKTRSSAAQAAAGASPALQQALNATTNIPTTQHASAAQQQQQQQQQQSQKASKFVSPRISERRAQAAAAAAAASSITTRAGATSNATAAGSAGVAVEVAKGVASAPAAQQPAATQARASSQAADTANASNVAATAVVQQAPAGSKAPPATAAVAAAVPSVMQCTSFCAAHALMLGACVTFAGTAPAAKRAGKILDIAVDTNVRYKLRFNDGTCDWITLENGQWGWLSPRAVSAGLTQAVRNALRKLGCNNLTQDQQNVAHPIPRTSAPVLRQGHAPAHARAAKGHKFWVFSPGDGRWYAAYVLSQSSGNCNKYHVVYQDGWDEWVDVRRDNVVWEEARSRPSGLGLPAGTTPPVGMSAIGWRLAVYWPQDETFYEGVVTDFQSSGTHKIAYDDGEDEVIKLDKETIVWRGRINGDQPVHTSRKEVEEVRQVLSPRLAANQQLQLQQQQQQQEQQAKVSQQQQQTAAQPVKETGKATSVGIDENSKEKEREKQAPREREGRQKRAASTSLGGADAKRARGSENAVQALPARAVPAVVPAVVSIVDMNALANFKTLLVAQQQQQQHLQRQQQHHLALQQHALQQQQQGKMAQLQHGQVPGKQAQQQVSPQKVAAAIQQLAAAAQSGSARGSSPQVIHSQVSQPGNAQQNGSSSGQAVVMAAPGRHRQSSGGSGIIRPSKPILPPLSIAMPSHSSTPSPSATQTPLSQTQQAAHDGVLKPQPQVQDMVAGKPC